MTPASSSRAAEQYDLHCLEQRTFSFLLFSKSNASSCIAATRHSHVHQILATFLPSTASHPASLNCQAHGSRALQGEAHFGGNPGKHLCSARGAIQVLRRAHEITRQRRNPWRLYSSSLLIPRARAILSHHREQGR